MKHLQYKRPSKALVLICLLASAATCHAANTNVDQTINPGLLTLTAPLHATMSSLNADAVHDQASSGSLGTVNVTDSRGTGAGWSLTATASSFTKVDQPIQVRGSDGTLTSSGTYSGSGNGAYIITITHSGSDGSAMFAVSGLADQGPTAVTSGDVPLGIQGVMVNFHDTSYTAGDQWAINANTIPANQLTITPSAINAMVGAYMGVSAGTAHTFTDSTDSATLMSAAFGSGLGWYTNTPSLSLGIPASTRAGTYTATITETLD